MTLISKIFYFFSRYTDPSERRVGRFFGSVTERDSPIKTEKKLVQLLQGDIAVINLWTEHRYKGYDYLTKAKRRELYRNLEAIKQDFVDFAAKTRVDSAQVLTHVASKGVDTAMLSTRREQLAYIAIIMRYLSPARGRYVYRASSSFGRLLRNPIQEVLEGDCNQIVTLYIALFAIKYDVSDLKLTVYPGHVALHFHGVDIETTNATFTRYDRPEQITTPIHEIVSINLLDTSDINYAKSAVKPEVLLQSARLAYAVSSHRQLVKKNLEAAYSNTVSHMLREQRHRQALEYARQSKDYELIEAAARSGTAHALKQHDFAGARRFAGYAQQKSELLRTIDSNEAGRLYSSRQFEAAARIYGRLGDKNMVQQCYRGLYGQEQSRLSGLKTVADIKAHAGVVRNLERYARQSGDQRLMRHAASLAKYL